MAEFTAGDRVVKMSGIAAGKYGTVNSVREDGTLNVTFDGERMARFCDPERCGKVAANATFKKGDRVKLKGSSKLGTVVGGMGTYIGAGSLGGGSDYPGDVTVRWDSYSFDTPVKPENLVLANSRACNRASVYEYGVGDTVKLRSGRTGEVLSKYVDKNGDIKIDVDLNGTRFTASPEMIDSVVKNSRACNAEITPELKKAYDEWMKAKAKFDKWWNPNRRLSENPPKGADATRKQLDFAAVFKKVTGKLAPNGYGSMTLEQMVDAVS